MSLKPFSDIDLSNAFVERKRQIKNKIDEFTNEEIVANDLELLVCNIYEEYFIEPVIIYEEEVKKRSIKQEKVKKRLDPLFRINPDKEYVILDGIITHFYFRYTGEKDLFKCRASTFSFSGYPSIELGNEYVELTYEISLEDMEKEEAQEMFFKQLENDIASIKCGIEYANNDVNAFNASIRDYATKCINEKKQKVDSFFNLAKIFEVPVEKTEFAKVHVPMQRNITPIAHKYEEQGTEYTISEKDYQDVLQAIKHTGSTFERTPGSYKSMGEEDLRNALLASLNATYKGNAYG